MSTGAVKRVRSKPHHKPYTLHWQVTPPMLALDTPTLSSQSDTYTLRGKATDDTHVEDVYIFVSNRDAKIDNRKVFYKSNRKGKKTNEMSFSHDIPLWPGSNFVTVVVRENDEVKATKYMYLHREPSKTARKTTTR